MHTRFIYLSYPSIPINTDCKGIGFHWYLNFIANWTDLDELNKKYPDQFLLATEACQEAPEVGSDDATALGSWNVFNR